MVSLDDMFDVIEEKLEGLEEIPYMLEQEFQKMIDSFRRLIGI